jgi:capsular exopolysaccharide synthesis family protein
MESRETIDLDLGKYLLIVKRRWLVAISIFTATVTLSALATTRLKPSYEAEGKLLFKIPTFNVIGSNLLPSSSEGGGGDLHSLVSTENPISTQIEVITSPAVLEKTINKLKLKDKKGEPIPAEMLKAGLKLKIIGGTDVLEITYKDRDPKVAAAVVNTVMNLYLKIDILSNRVEAGGTRKFMAKQLPKIQADVLQAALSLRKFKQKYHLVDLAEETKTTIGILGNLNTEINTVSADLSQVNGQANELRRKIKLNSQEAINVSALSQSHAVQGVLTQVQDIDRQLATERSRFSGNNPTIISLEAKRNNLNILLQQQIAQTIGYQTTVPQNQMQIGDLRQSLILSFLQSDVQAFGLRQKLYSLYNSRHDYEYRKKIIPMLSQIEGELERKLEVAHATYQTLLQKVQELQVAENQNTSSARIIAEAEVPQKPSSGQKLIILVLGVLSGAFLSTSTIVFMEISDRSLKTLKEIREICGYTLLGIIPLFLKKVSFRYQDMKPTWLGIVPWFGKKLPSPELEIESRTPQIAVIEAPHSLTSEMYRMIQANLRFLSSDKVYKIIVITSAISQEGKSTVAANLAAAIAQLGRQVLLIDADMRGPSQHHLWQINSKVGLSEVLVGQSKFNLACSKVMDNLDVLPAGSRPPNPLALLDSQHMATLIENFTSQYDFVIIDAPPLLLAPDAMTLSHMTDGILLVARPGLIDANSIRAAQDMLKRTSCHVLGLIINGVIAKNEADNLFYHPKEYFNPAKIPKKEQLKVP